MASAAGVKLGTLLSINEAGGNAGPQPIRFQAARAESASLATPISAGEQTLSVTVNLTYALEE